jgi:glycosyltransferase involved in cell wall biosynthesis
MKTILLTAYAVNPTKGSEDGMGWNFILQAAKRNKIIAITRENNRDSIEAVMSQDYRIEYNNIQFLYFDLPASQRWWKKGGRGSMLYFFLWQKNIVRFIQDQKLDFDIVHNLNFHNDWTPTYLWKLGKPLVWGPVGHHSRIPFQFIRGYGLKAQIQEIAKSSIKKMVRRMPIFKKAARNADTIFCMNSQVEMPANPLVCNKILMPSVGTDTKVESGTGKPEGFHVLSAGRFVPLKGFDLTLRAFALFLDQLTPQEKTQATLTLIGAGPNEHRLMTLAKSLNLEPYVRWVPWVPLSEMDAYYRNSHVFLFPSHEGAGMVVAEAMSFGLPVVCLDNDGPGELVHPASSLKVAISDYSSTVTALGQKLSDLYLDNNLYQNEVLLALDRIKLYLSWNAKGEILRDVYSTIAR